MKKISLVFWILTVSFVITGLLFLFCPYQLVESSNILGNSLGFDPLPHSKGKIWGGFSFSYMVLVSTLAYLIAKNPKDGDIFLILLALGKVSSSLSALAFYFLDRGALLYLTTFLIDGAISGITIYCWFLVRANAQKV